jgi:hypothetical protein
MVDNGLGVSPLPDWSALWSGGLAIGPVKLPGHAPVRRIAVIWSVHSPRAGLISQFLKHARAVFADPAGRVGDAPICTAYLPVRFVVISACTFVRICIAGLQYVFLPPVMARHSSMFPPTDVAPGARAGTGPIEQRSRSLSCPDRPHAPGRAPCTASSPCMVALVLSPLDDDVIGLAVSHIEGNRRPLRPRELTSRVTCRRYEALLRRP